MCCASTAHTEVNAHGSRDSAMKNVKTDIFARYGMEPAVTFGRYEMVPAVTKLVPK